MKKSIILLLISLLGVVLISGFSRDKNKRNPDNFVHIPMGATEISGMTYSLDSYWISDHEITNEEYNKFLANLQRQGRTEEYEICMIDNENWISKSEEYNAPYAEYYSTQEAYSKYPVLNISHEAARIYCNWLTENSEDKSQEFRLPTKEEWIYAAKGGLNNSVYSWDGIFLRNKKGESRCNYKAIGDECIHTKSDNNYTILDIYKEINPSRSSLAPAYSYSTNNYGLYNACGNVAEMVSTRGIAMGGSWNNTGYDVRILSEQDYNESNPFVGFRPVRVKKN